MNLEENISSVVNKITANTLSRVDANVRGSLQMIFNAGGSQTGHVFHKQIIFPSQHC
jgi:hypothetical protein